MLSDVDIKKALEEKSIEVNPLDESYIQPSSIDLRVGSEFRVFENHDTSNKVSSIIAILGAINLPIIKFSVDWWNTLHQPASISLTEKSAIHSSMLVPLAIMTAAFALFSVLIFLMKYNTELIKIKNKGLDRL